MPPDDPDDPELLHDHEIQMALGGTILLPAPSVKAKHVFVGLREVPAAAAAPGGAGAGAGAGAAPAPFKKTYYYRLIFHPAPHVRVSEEFDAGEIGSVGALRTISGKLEIPTSAPNPLPEGYVFTEKEILTGLNALKNSITVSGGKGEKPLARKSKIRVPKETHVSVYYEVRTLAEDAAEARFCNPCPPPNGPDGKRHLLPF